MRREPDGESANYLCANHVDSALHVEIPFANVIMLAVENFPEAPDRLLN